MRHSKFRNRSSMLARQKLTKKQKRALKLQGVIVNSGLELPTITPLTFNQHRVFKEYQQKNQHLVLHGSAGTGKTFMALYLALRDVHDLKAHRVVVIRSAVPSRKQGFLPGNEKEKEAVYETPYISNVNEIYGRGDAYNILIQKKQIEFVSTSYLRGITLRNAIVIVDEIQNMAWHEIVTVMTRLGEGCRVILCGDTKQSDLDERAGKSDVLKLLEVTKNMDDFAFVQMTPSDIVRGGLVKSFIMECEKLGY